VKANKIMKGQAAPNHRRKKGKKVESNIDSPAHNQTLKQQRQLNDQNHLHLTILTLNANRSIPPSKDTIWQSRQKGRSNNLLSIGDYLINQNKHWHRLKGWKKINQANDQGNQAGEATLISYKVDFKLTLIKRDKERHPILIKGEILQKEITIINLHAPKVNVPNFIKHTLKDIKTYINSNTVVVGDSNTPLSPIDRSSKQKINKEILDLNHNKDQMDLADVYRIFHPTIAQYTFFSAAHGTISKTDHILGHKLSLSKYKKIEIIPCILSNHNA
jgi:hypothetical protein